MLGKRTAKLSREAMVLAHRKGSRWGHCHGRDDEYPPASEVVSRVLGASVSLTDLSPALPKTDEAQAAYGERRPPWAELLTAALGPGGESR